MIIQQVIAPVVDLSCGKQGRTDIPVVHARTGEGDGLQEVDHGFNRFVTVGQSGPLLPLVVAVLVDGIIKGFCLNDLQVAFAIVTAILHIRQHTVEVRTALFVEGYLRSFVVLVFHSLQNAGDVRLGEHHTGMLICCGIDAGICKFLSIKFRYLVPKQLARQCAHT